MVRHGCLIFQVVVCMGLLRCNLMGMTTEYIGDPPLEAIIPVTLGCSRTFTIERVDANNLPVNWDATIKLAVETSKTQQAVIINGVVNGTSARITVPANVCDTVKNTTSWQLIMIPSSDSNPVAVMVGKFERHDN